MLRPALNAILISLHNDLLAHLECFAAANTHKEKEGGTLQHVFTRKHFHVTTRHLRGGFKRRENLLKYQNVELLYFHRV